MKTPIRISLFILMVLLLGACKSTYQIRSEKVKRVSDRKIIRHVINHYVDYKAISYKFNGEFSDSGKTVSFSGNLRIKNDSLIWVSISVALGIELARIQITPDSVYFMNKIKDEYFIRNVDYISNVFQVDMDYDILQSILTNRIFLYAEDDEDANQKRREEEPDEYPVPDKYRKTFISDTDSNLYVLKTYRKRKLKKHMKRNRGDIILQTFRVIPDVYKIHSVNINDISEKRELNVEYSKFTAIDSLMLPNHIRIDVKDRSRNVSLDLDFTKITINPEVTFPFTIPEKFKPIETRRQ